MATDTARKFDWVSRHDERSKEYSIPSRTTQRGYRLWTEGPALDQGQNGYCVGFGWTDELLCEPIVTGLPTFDFAAGLFHLALKFDDVAGEVDTQGTSVLAGAKAAQKMGFIGSYRWCFGVDEVARGVYNHGPVVVGTAWLDSMEDPQIVPGFNEDVHGHARLPDMPLLDCSGNEVGGHCYLITGFTRFGDNEYFRIRNSWGATWGQNGSALIRKSDMAALLRNTGEACIAFDVAPVTGLANSPQGMVNAPIRSGW